MSEQFYKMTIEKALEGYSQGLLTTTGLIHLYFEIKLKYGWKGRYKPANIIEELGISKPAFYKAIAKLQTLGMISIEIHGEITVTNTNPDSEQSPIVETVSNRRKQSPIVDKNLQSETKISNQRQDSTIVENEGSKPLPGKDSSPSSDLYSDSYQIFIKSLSDWERENFENFCLEKANELPKRPSLPKAWIKKHWEDLKAKWVDSRKGSDDSSYHQTKWTTHPRFDELVHALKSEGFGAFPITYWKDKEAMSFFDHVKSTPTLKQEILSCLN